jgi:hypothetical protein
VGQAALGGCSASLVLATVIVAALPYSDLRGPPLAGAEVVQVDVAAASCGKEQFRQLVERLERGSL